MRNSKRVLLCCAAAGLIAMTGAALASHGRAGLWSMSVTVSGPRAVPDMSKLPPEIQARLRAAGMSTSANGNTMTVQHCMTPSEVATDVPHMEGRTSKYCKAVNVKLTGHTMSADMVCSGQFTGNGHMQYLFDGDSHFTGEVSMSGTTADGAPIHNDEKIEGRWLSADCGSVTH